MVLGRIQRRFAHRVADADRSGGVARVAVCTTDPSLLAPLGSLLDEGRYRLRVSRRPEKLGAFVDNEAADALLIDLRLLADRPLETFGELHGRLAEIPVIGLCGEEVPYEVREQALREGLWDVVELPVATSELVAKLGAWVPLHRESDDLGSAALTVQQSVRFTSQHMRRWLEELATLTRRANTTLSCVVFGVDPGREGERLTPESLWEAGRHFSLVLRNGTRASDIVGSLEPLKYMVLAPETPAPGGLRLAERFTSLSRVQRVGGELPVTFGAGVSCVAGQDAPSEVCPDSVLTTAVRALNRARAAGEARVAPGWGAEPERGKEEEERWAART